MSERFTFSGLSEVFAKANEEKSGDRLAGIAARSEQERIAAKCTLADLPLRDIIARPLPAASDRPSALWRPDACQPGGLTQLTGDGVTAGRHAEMSPGHVTLIR